MLDKDMIQRSVTDGSTTNYVRFDLVIDDHQSHLIQLGPDSSSQEHGSRAHYRNVSIAQQEDSSNNIVRVDTASMPNNLVIKEEFVAKNVGSSQDKSDGDSKT